MGPEQRGQAAMVYVNTLMLQDVLADPDWAVVANTHDGLQAARARGKLTPQQATLAQQLYDTGEHTVQEIAGIFGVPRTTVYGHLDQSTIGSRPGALTTANGNG